MAQKQRIDVLLVERGFFTTREKARRSILAGQIMVDKNRIDKPGTQVDSQAFIEVKGGKEYVSRAAEKLEKALIEFRINPAGKVALDAGAGTGGFAQVLLKYEARKVYAVDVGYGVLDWRLRQDPRVVVLERTNVRYLEADKLQEMVDFVTADLSFISLKKVIGNLKRLAKEDADFVLLIKPQFEAGREKVGKGGLVKDANVHKEVLSDLLGYFTEDKFKVEGLTYSPITGADGNIEFVVWLKRSDLPCRLPAGRQGRQGVGVRLSDEELEKKIDRTVREAHAELSD